jgi:uncharacterized protein (TIGR03437 family)
MRVLRLGLLAAVLLMCSKGFGQCTPPAITVQPVSFTVPYGTVVTFNVIATGTGPLSYQWYLAPNNGAPAKVGEDSPQYTPPPVTAIVIVYVVVSNACGSAASNLVGASLAANPTPTVVYEAANSASAYFSGQNGFGIAQGSLFVIYGSGLGPATLQQASLFPIGTVLAGTSVQISVSGVTYAAPIIYTSASQVAAILPSSVPVGNATLTVTYNGTPALYPISIQVVQSAFGIFTVTSNGVGPGVIQDVNNRLLTFAQPAHAGDTVVIWGTGLGPVSGAEADGPLPGNNFKPEVFAGNQPAAVQYAGRSGCCAALDQIVIQVPQNVQGCFVPVTVRTGGFVSNFVSLPVGAAGAACSDPVGFSPDLLTKAATGPGATVAAIALGPIPVLQNAGFSFTQGLSERLSALLGSKVSEQDLKTMLRASGAHRGRAWKTVMKKYAPVLKARNVDPDTIVAMVSALNYQGVRADFQQFGGPTSFWSQFAFALPPPGTCTAGRLWQSQGGASGAENRAGDAGPQLLFTGPGGTQTLNQLSNGGYQLMLAPGSTNFGLPSGTYSVSSNGGRSVGAFTASLQVGSSLTWSNKSSAGFIDRSQQLTVNWSGGPPSGYVVFGGTAGGGFYPYAFTCVEDVRKQTLTVPDFVLSAMPHTSNGSVFLTAHPLQNLFSAPGIDAGYFADLSSDSKTIGYQ